MASKKLLTPLVFSLFGIKHKKRRKEERPLLTTFSNTGSSRKVTAYILGACDLDRAPGFISNMGGLLCTQATLARRRCLGTSNLLQQGEVSRRTQEAETEAARIQKKAMAVVLCSMS